MTNNELDEIIENIIDEKNERALIILASSFVDDLLFFILSKYLIAPIKNEENLIKGDNPLSTFSSRIKTVYRLGLIDESFLSILDKIRDIRNKFAHRTNIKADKSSLKDKLSHLHKLLKDRNAFKLTQKRYFINDPTPYNEIKITYITVCLILKGVYDNITPIVPNKQLVNSTKK